jgi:pilus assembly protein Flp/PilA
MGMRGLARQLLPRIKEFVSWAPYKYGQASGPENRGGAMKAYLIRFWLGTSGATAIEYAMIAAGISLAVVASITKLGATVDGLFQSVLTALK